MGIELHVAGVSSERVPFYEAAEPPSWETSEELREPPLRAQPDGGYEWAVDREAFAAELMAVAHAHWEKWKADFLAVVSVDPRAWLQACERLAEHDDPWHLLYNPCDSPWDGFAFPVESGMADCPFEVLHAMMGMAPVLESFAPFSTPDCEHLLQQSFRLQPERKAGLAEDATEANPQDGSGEPLPSIRVRLQQPARTEGGEPVLPGRGAAHRPARLPHLGPARLLPRHGLVFLSRRALSGELRASCCLPETMRTILGHYYDGTEAERVSRCDQREGIYCAALPGLSEALRGDRVLLYPAGLPDGGRTGVRGRLPVTGAVAAAEAEAAAEAALVPT